VVKVESIEATVAALAAWGVDAEEPSGSDGILTTWLSDPDGYRIELVQWPPGHPDGMTAADWRDS
jgi:lactoylglutathione lyase